VIIKREKSIIENYFEDNSGAVGAYADFVAVAERQDDVPPFLAEMSTNNTPVTVAGALTGNTASGLAFGGATLSLERLDNIGEIRVISPEKALIKAEAGARISDIKEKVFSKGWMYPPDPTEKNASIGGNIATNASGGRGFKFGVTRDYINALKIVFSDGSSSYIERGKYFADASGNISFDTDKGIKRITLPKYVLPRIKNAAGYYNYPNADLIDVFIGSDGTLGVTLEAELILIPRFDDVFGGIVFFDEKQKAYGFVNKVKEVSKRSSGESSVSAMSLEYFDRNALLIIKDDYPMVPENAQAAIMFEQDVYGDAGDLLTQKWIDLMEECGIDAGGVWFASNLAEQENFRKLRHKIPERVNEKVRRNKIPKVGTDFAVPEGKLAQIIEFCDREFEKSELFNLTFGHIGENHLHANIIPSSREEYVRTKEMYARIAQKAVELGGTVSAEHGIGKIKHIFLEKMVGRAGFIEMAKFKKSLDASAVLGRGNIIPEEYL
jgi:D-lactate dehydrogenase (cytochrome)